MFLNIPDFKMIIFDGSSIIKRLGWKFNKTLLNIAYRKNRSINYFDMLFVFNQRKHIDNLLRKVFKYEKIIF